jgi:hypothetical protein
MLLELDTSEPHALLVGGTCFCLGFHLGIAWSPDGKSMAVSIPGNGKVPDGLTIMNADGTGSRLVPGGWELAAWLPAPSAAQRPGRLRLI